MKLFSAPKKGFSQQTLYFAKWSDFSGYEILPEVNMVIYDDRKKRDISDLEYLSELAGGLVFSDEQEYNDCFNSFEQCFLDAYRMEENLRSISSIVYEDGDLQSMANRIAVMFDHPMNIVDNSFSVIASSTNYEFFSEDLARDNQSGHIPPQILKTLNLASQRRRTTGNRTIVIDHIEGEFHNYFTPILFNNITLGYFSIFLRPEEVMSAMEKGYLARVAELIGVYMQKGDFSRANRGSYYTSLLSSLLSENRQMHNIEEERFQIFGYRMRKFKFVILANSSQESPDDYFLGDLSQSIKNILGNCVYALQRNQIIFLASYHTPNEEIVPIMDRLENLLLETPFVNIGISSPYVILNETRGHYLEAQAAIEAAMQFQGNERVSSYDKYRLMHMVQALGHHTDIKLFSLPQLRLLTETDHRNKSELLYTLYTYIHSSQDIAKTCEALHIHRNTLYFRLSKIRELTHLDLQNAENVAMILISFTIMQLQNELDWEVTI